MYVYRDRTVNDLRTTPVRVDEQESKLPRKDIAARLLALKELFNTNSNFCYSAEATHMIEQP